ncbi:MAG TPA: LptF/LptG family permease [Deltaproteobacteria bacterium]|nr:LptF/LptG family permease [Deltaproteobacteria bacterium]
MLIRRYIAAHIVKAFAASLAVLSGVMIIVQWLQMGSLLTIRDFDLVLLELVPMGRYIIPVALLFSILFVLERLSSESEVIAMQACGVTKASLYRPAIEIAVVCMLVNLAISLYGGPLSMQRIQTRLISEAPKRMYAFLKERDFDESFKGMTIYVQSVNPAKRRIQGLFIEDKGRDHHVITAERGAIEVVDDRVRLKLVNGSLYTARGPIVRYVTFKEYAFFLKVNFGRQVGIRNWEIATQPELKALIAQDPQVKWIKEYHNRLAFPVLNLILGVMGVAFGVQRPRSPKFTGFVVGIATIFGYYLVFLLADRLVRGGTLDPVIGAWTPDLVFCGLLAGLWLWRRSGIGADGNL